MSIIPHSSFSFESYVNNEINEAELFINIDISDTEQAIAQLKQDILHLTDVDISGLTDDVTTLYDLVNSNNEEITYINETSIPNILDDIDNLKTIDISNLQYDVSYIKNIDISNLKYDVSYLIHVDVSNAKNDIKDLSTNFNDLSTNFNDLSTNFNDLSLNHLHTN